MLSSPCQPSLSVMQASPAGQWIAQIAYWNKKAVYGLLFKASAETVMTIAADPKRMGAKVGLTSVLHTWGSAMTHHPHIHMIVPPSRQICLANRLPDNGWRLIAGW
jgi:hypothetical protein